MEEVDQKTGPFRGLKNTQKCINMRERKGKGRIGGGEEGGGKKKLEGEKGEEVGGGEGGRSWKGRRGKKLEGEKGEEVGWGIRGEGKRGREGEEVGGGEGEEERGEKGERRGEWRHPPLPFSPLPPSLPPSHPQYNI